MSRMHREFLRTFYPRLKLEVMQSNQKQMNMVKDFGVPVYGMADAQAGLKSLQLHYLEEMLKAK